MSSFDRMRAQLRALVEPQTRYSVQTLELRQGAETLAGGVVEVSEGVQFSAHTSRGAGALPGGIAARPNEADVHSAVQQQVLLHSASVSARLVRWSNGKTLDARLATGDCWDGPTAFGSTRTCETCSGAKQLTCRSCGGRGTSRCTSCDGAGNARCGSCRGGRVSCSSCGGHRGKNVQTGTDGSFRWEQCYGCGGSGTQACSGCGGSGRRICMMCSSGNVRCASCSGGGKVNCTGCNATGSTHFIARLECSVSHDVSFTHRLADEQVAAEFAALSAREMMNLCHVSPREPVVNGARVVRSYDVSLPVAELFVQVAGEQLRLLGLGEDAQVRNFRNVVGRLLEHDVHALREARAGHPWLVLAPSVALERALEIVLDSEANQSILDSAHAKRAGNDQSPDRIADALHSAVSAEYVKALDTEFSASLRRAVLGPLGIPMAGVASGVAVLAFGIAHLLARFGAWTASYQPTAFALIVVVASTLSAEWWARQRLARQFDGPSWIRLTPLISRLRLGLLLRCGAIATGALLWVALARLIPLRTS